MTGVAVMSRTSAHPPLPPDEADSPGEDARPATRPAASPAASAAPSRDHRPGSQAPPIVKRTLPQPAASDLRLITTIIKVNSDFERIADCAVNVAQRVLPLAQLDEPRYQPPPDLRLMGNSVVGTLRDTIKAFNLQDDQLARRVLRSDDVVDALYHQIVQDMLTMMQSNAEQANIDLSNIMIAKNLERIADHCTNIAENVIYVHSGRIIRHLHAAP